MTVDLRSSSRGERRKRSAGLAHWFFFLVVLFCFTVSAGGRAGGLM